MDARRLSIPLFNTASAVGLFLLFFSLTFFRFSACAQGVVVTEKDNPWSKVSVPSTHPPQVYGGYTAGCMSGAETMPLSGVGFEIMHPTRNRFYGHPDLTNLLKRAGTDLPKPAPLLIGDLAQPRGGPMMSGHSSHQVGLDVDIWLYELTPKQQTDWKEEWRENLSMISVVTPDYKTIEKKHWKKSFETQLLWFASQPEVERIFVNAAIKKQLCLAYPNRLELAKIRPWYYHTAHFHVRIKCPAGNSECHGQPTVTGIECGSELDSWFDQATLDGQINPPPSQPKAPVHLPQACAGVLKQ